MKSLNHRESIEEINRQIEAKGFCSEDDKNALRYHEGQQKKNAFKEIKSELSKPFVKILDRISKALS